MGETSQEVSREWWEEDELEPDGRLGMPMGTDLVYDCRRGVAVALFGLAVWWSSADGDDDI